MDEMAIGATQSDVGAARPSLSYATAYGPPPPRHGMRVWAGLAILLGGLGLVVLGGCFMIGILMLVTNGKAVGFSNTTNAPPTIGGAGYSLMVVLYVLAFGCFAGGATVIVVGVRGLYGVLKAG